jgi:copper transport protein
MFALLILLIGGPAPASAHAFLVTSDPVAGAILPDQPDEIRLTFSERLEPDATSAALFDHLGAEIGGSSYRIENEVDLILTLPPGLPNGTYSVVYRNLSRDDGHPARGHLPFTIGTGADLRPVASPAMLDDWNGAPDWLRTGSRWIAYTGLLSTLALWPIWSIVIAPALGRRPGALRTAIGTVRKVTFVAFTIAMVGNFAALVSQALERDDAFIDALTATLFDTRFGELWLFRMLLLGLLATTFTVVSWARPFRSREPSVIAFVLSLGLALPFSLNSHAAAQVSGRTFAIAADLLHLISAGLWGGGSLLLAAVLWNLRKHLDRAQFRQVLIAHVPRFSAVAIAAWILLIVSGAYAAWLQIGNLDAARATAYGNAFLLKVGIAAVLLAFGATQFAVIGRRLHHETWSRRFQFILIAETIGIVLILLVTGRMTAAPPARDALAQETTGITLTLLQNDLSAELTISPAAAGPNHYQLTFAGNVPSDSEALLRITPPGDVFDQTEVLLTPIGPNIWDTHGSELSLAGGWSIEAVIRKAGEFQWQASSTVAVAAEPQSLPGQPWRFSLNALAGLAMLVIGAIALARVLAIPGGRSRKETAGIGLAGLAIGAAFLISARLEPPPTFALADDTTIARGSAIYAQQCLACHGVTGQGNGPDAAGLPVPPSDFTDPVHQLHSDSSLTAYIRNGFPLSGMPGFAETLSAPEIADVIAYLRSIGVGASGLDLPTAADCTIAPRDIDQLIEITTAAPPDPSNMLEWPIGNPAPTGQQASVEETVRQYIACSNAGDYERVLATSTLRYLAPQFATLDDAGRTAALDLAANPQPNPEGEWLAIASIEPARALPDGRLATRVITLDPINHPHQLESILILAEEDGIWRIDEVHVSAPDFETTQTASNWPLTTTIDNATVALTVGSPTEQGRPLRVKLTDRADASIDGATGTIVVVPRGAGVPLELELANVDPGVYFVYAPALPAGTYVAEIELTLPDGSTVVAGFRFVLE